MGKKGSKEKLKDIETPLGFVWQPPTEREVNKERKKRFYSLPVAAGKSFWGDPVNPSCFVGRVVEKLEQEAERNTLGVFLQRSHKDDRKAVRGGLLNSGGHKAQVRVRET